MSFVGVHVHVHVAPLPMTQDCKLLILKRPFLGRETKLYDVKERTVWVHYVHVCALRQKSELNGVCISQCVADVLCVVCGSPLWQWTNVGHV